MLETYKINCESQISNSEKENSPKKVIENTKHKSSTSFSSLDSSFDNLNIEIKSLLENDNDISFSSDSNSENDENKANMEYLFSSKFWKDNKDKSLSSKKQSLENTENNDLNISFFQKSSSYENNAYNFKNKINEDEVKKELNNIKIIKKDYIKPKETNINLKNNNNIIQIFPGVYLNPQIYNQYINKMNYNNNIKTHKNENNINDLSLLINKTQTIQMIPINININLNNIHFPKGQPQLNPPIEKININNSNLSIEINKNADNPQKIIQEEITNSNINNTSSNLDHNKTIKEINDNNYIINKPINTNKGNNKGGKQFLNLDDLVSGKNTCTTVMIRNIPIKYTDKILNEELEEFKGKYDCLYVPYDYEKNGNKGYAFINFVHPLHILYFYEKFNGKKWKYFESLKICELNFAHFQGINEIQKHAKNYKGLKKPNFYLSTNGITENMVIPSKYILKLLQRFPKMKFTENKVQKTIVVQSFE
jgi:hypothetical protein